MKGRRRKDVMFGDVPPSMRPGDYWRYLDRETGEPMDAAKLDAHRSNLTGGVWGVLAPNGAGVGTLVHHTVREHDDRTISVVPGDGSSNSILIQGAGNAYHGYIERGVWRSV